jgi:hypothetical protein
MGMVSMRNTLTIHAVFTGGEHPSKVVPFGR